MKIELLVSRAGPAGVQNRGDVIDVGDAEAARMSEAAQAVPVRGETRETATKKDKRERATK